MTATVAIRTRRTWLTPHTVDVKHTIDAYGGCGPASFTIIGDLVQVDTLNPGTSVTITDSVSGEMPWSGQVSSVDTTTVEGIQALAVTCEGTAALTRDRRFGLGYAITRQDGWEMDFRQASVAGSDVRIGDVPWMGSTPSVGLTFPSMTLRQGDRVRARFAPFEDNASLGAMQFGALTGTRTNGFVASAWENRIFVGGNDLDEPSVMVYEADASNSTAVTRIAGSGTIPRGQIRLVLEWTYQGSANVTTDAERGAYWYALTVYGQRRTRDKGYASMANPGPIDPVDIVEDLIGRCLTTVVSPDLGRSPKFDTYGTTPRFLLDSFDYSDSPATVSEILDDLCAFNPAFYWMMSAASPDDGLCGLTFAAWDTFPTYSISDDQIVWGSTGDDALYNQVIVRYKDARGKHSTASALGRADTYPDLEDLLLPSGELRIRQAEPVDLGDRPQTATNAQRLADVLLDQLARRPLGGTVTVTEPVVHLRSGRVVPPPGIRPGVMAAVGDALLRVTKVEVDWDSGSATLTLGTPRPSVSDLLAYARRPRYGPPKR